LIIIYGLKKNSALLVVESDDLVPAEHVENVEGSFNELNGVATVKPIPFESDSTASHDNAGGFIIPDVAACGLQCLGNEFDVHTCTSSATG